MKFQIDSHLLFFILAFSCIYLYCTHLSIYPQHMISSLFNIIFPLSPFFWLLLDRMQLKIYGLSLNILFQISFKRMISNQNDETPVGLKDPILFFFFWLVLGLNFLFTIFLFFFRFIFNISIQFSTIFQIYYFGTKIINIIVEDNFRHVGRPLRLVGRSQN